MEKYLDTINEIEEKFKSWKLEALSGQKNQAAALRARKISMELRDDLKNFRVISVQNDSLIKESKKNN